MNISLSMNCTAAEWKYDVLKIHIFEIILPIDENH
jgi:hypothetical protein